jgi:hypothetical protein
MARKTTGTTSTRSKKTSTAPPPANMQVRELPTNGTSPGMGALPVNAIQVNLEEQIRVRAYELYLQRRATAGSANGNGNESQDWLIAEREVLSRHNGPDHHSA